MYALSFVDLRQLYRYAYPLYILAAGLVVAVALFGYTAMGATRWLKFGGFGMQPAEPFKLAVILFLARYFQDMQPGEISKVRTILYPFTCVLMPTALIIKQPDLGTGILVLGVMTIMLFVAGVQLWKFISAGFFVCALSPIIWSNLRDYQKKRILVFLYPDSDRLNSGYNILQSKIAIGSGGLWGKGLGQGSQSQLSFLPEHETDFIFACLAEDMGFIGVLALFLVYILIILIGLGISINARSTFGKLVAAGIMGMFFIHIFVNIGMVTGILPAVGIPLPLVSYGGTMVLSMMTGFGLLLSVNRFHGAKI